MSYNCFHAFGFSIINDTYICDEWLCARKNAISITMSGNHEGDEIYFYFVIFIVKSKPSLCDCSRSIDGNVSTEMSRKLFFTNIYEARS